jgi:hypothetical protein
MPERGDNTWLIVGVGAGCGLGLLASCCLLGVVAYLPSSQTRTAPPAPTSAWPGPPTPRGTPVPTALPAPPIVPPSPPLPSGTSEAPDDRAPRVVHATVTAVTGSPGVSVGQICEFNVERRDREDGSGFWCNAQIVCGGHALYGGPNAGFFPCALFSAPTRGVVGSDPNTTAVDGDAAMSIDSQASTLEIWDDAQGPNGECRITAHIDSVL